MKRLVILAIGLSCVVSLAGWSSPTVNLSASTLTKTQFAKKGNAICKKYNEVMSKADEAAYLKLFKANPTKAEVKNAAPAIARLLKSFRAEISEFKALKPPVSARKGFKLLLKHMNETVAPLKKAIDAAKAGNGSKTKGYLLDVVTISSKSDGFLRKFGLKGCV